MAKFTFILGLSTRSIGTSWRIFIAAVLVLLLAGR